MNFEVILVILYFFVVVVLKNNVLTFEGKYRELVS